MENYKIKKDQLVNKGQHLTSKAIINFMSEHLLDEVDIKVFKQENPKLVKVPAQLNTYCGHKLIGTYDLNTQKFEAIKIEEEDISEIMTHKNKTQWKNPV